jgi:hypothetical protein
MPHQAIERARLSEGAQRTSIEAGADHHVGNGTEWPLVEGALDLLAGGGTEPANGPETEPDRRRVVSRES